MSIDREGIPVMVQFLPETTALFNDQQRNLFLEAIMGYRYEASPTGPCIETGKFSIILQKISDLY